MPKKGELVDNWCDRVSDLGIPVSEEGADLLQKLDNEVEKRNQDRLDMHIYNDWNGGGMSECFENYVCRTLPVCSRLKVCVGDRLTCCRTVERLQQGHL
jgi:hypothetical protein